MLRNGESADDGQVWTPALRFVFDNDLELTLADFGVDAATFAPVVVDPIVLHSTDGEFVLSFDVSLQGGTYVLTSVEGEIAAGEFVILVVENLVGA